MIELYVNIQVLLINIIYKDNKYNVFYNEITHLKNGFSFNSASSSPYFVTPAGQSCDKKISILPKS